ncbi:ABC transporter ATP-binding protein [Microbacterium pseudoresistens]|uniref:Urea ABC transporter ATP-binding protein UrtE n=1 Tax=Microbacterium pseudoresistens TaxID=640634 RepID=A0A7Y9ETV0_9MICO|nr:ABC transporter ATP-binding protein [Microbacterium pseudoresistens]NYD53848.1 urea ABC transporter ATP-binding protein UrtE [Microbacterium pseudoresistens]
MLDIQRLVAGYGPLVVVRDIDLSVSAGEISVLIGRNGVGKTTLLRAVAGHRRATEGSVAVAGEEVTSFPPHRRARAGIAYVPQGRDIFGTLTVKENLLVAVKAMRMRDPSRRLAEILDMLPLLGEKLQDRGASLSGGQQQILAIGRALISDPKVLLLDEPSEGIQPSIVAEIAETVARIAQERGLAVLVVEQNLDFVAKVAERVRVIDRGQIVANLRVEDLVREESLQHQYLGV